MRQLLLLTLLPACAGEEAPRAAPVATPEATVVVRSVRGNVEARRGDTWAPAMPGDRLSLDEAVRSHDDAEATLAIGDDAEVLVRQRSEVSVRKVARDVARLRLERGRIGANLKKAGKLNLQVESTGSSAVAEADGGTFAVFNNGHGLVAVAAETAEVKLRTAGNETQVRAGEQATVRASDPRPAVARIPSAVFLNVVWPEEATRDYSTVVRGKVDPGTDLSMNGRSVEVKSDGSFETRLPLLEGANPIEVQATDTLGRVKRAKRTVESHRKGPKVKAEAGGLWK